MSKLIEVINFAELIDIPAFRFNLDRSNNFYLFPEEVEFILKHVDLLRRNYLKFQKERGEE